MSEPPNGWERNYKARPISAEEWEMKYDLFKKLYLDEDRNLSEVRWIMARDHGFYAKEVQCKKRISKWGLEKNVRKEHMKAMLRIQEKRALEGRKTAFKFNGRPVSEEKLVRSRKRLKLREEPGSPGDIPESVAYWTPDNSAPEDSGENDSEDDSDSPPSFSDRENSPSPSQTTQSENSSSIAASPLQDGSASKSLIHFDSFREMSSVGQSDYRYENELKLYRRTLTEREETLGKDHLDTLCTVNDMAAVYYSIERYDCALKLYRRALCGKEIVLGEEHPLTLHSVYNIALTLYRQECHNEALEFFWWALTGKKLKNIPAGEDPSQYALLEKETFLGAAINMTTIFYQLGQYTDAFYWCGRALDGVDFVLKNGHTPPTLGKVALDTANTLCEQARAWLEQPHNHWGTDRSGGCHLLPPDAIKSLGDLCQKLATFTDRYHPEIPANSERI
ncbi:hypothetical protein RUND412_007088 [Rhizina undulata]